ncbi:MAG: type II toxin-antitoxin system VapC family toxin [Nitrospirae bacterium]|nr:type II toxin-antitoxin system VapC family toxin [Nitrospirota bacterium]MDA8338441.1 type II toxin-antitoxin system VapC family toxin [Nitrospiraceae bacterium]
MVKLVADASVLSAFFLDEEDGQKIQQLIESDAIFYAPSFWRFEVSNAIWKRREIPGNIAEGLIEDVWDFTVYEELPTKWAKEAFHISKEYNLPFYDSSYIAMSISFNIPLWTFDRLQSDIAVKTGVSLWGK